MDKTGLLSNIPKVDEILKESCIQKLQDSYPRSLVVDSIREVLEQTRQFILKNDFDKQNSDITSMGTITEKVRNTVHKAYEPHLKRVINCTGVILHTNLGRAVLCRDAVSAVCDVAGEYTNLEYDLDKGQRGSRYSHVEKLLNKITGAEASLVVNNNAAAVLLVLSTLCKGKEAVVSRGELVEIGGSFRVPEVMEQSGAILKEVGTTNRTHSLDYENAVNENTGVLMKVHTSNYRILGFTETASRNELCEIGRKSNLPVVEDIGSGSFIDLSKYGLSYEPTVQEAVSSGMDVVTFSGDKMLGGPQAGIIVGRKKYLDLMKKNPLNRALRIDKMTLAALEATLKKYMDEQRAIEDIPVLRMILEKEDSIRKRARLLLNKLKASIGSNAELSIIKEYSQIGGGSMPLENLPTYAVCIKPACMSVNNLEERLRLASVPVIVRKQNDSIVMDVRTIRNDEFNIICGTITDILKEVNL